MYERMSDKSHEPSGQEIEAYMGHDRYSLLCMLEKQLKERYQLKRELRFPFGNNYGWGYKFSHKSFHLCYAFFEKDAFNVMLQIGDRQVPVLEEMLDSLAPAVQELWKNRYPCG